MRAQEIPSGARSVDALRLVERPDPKPGHGQVLVRVRAASLNYRDQAVITGNYFGGVVQQDIVPLSDGAGEVLAVGPGVTRVRTGDRVAGTFFLGWTDGPPRGPYAARGAPPVDGMLAEYALLDEQDVVPIPPSLSFEQAATLPCAAATTWHGLVETGERATGRHRARARHGRRGKLRAALRTRGRRARDPHLVERREARASERARRLGHDQLPPAPRLGAGGPPAHRWRRRDAHHRDRRSGDARRIDAGGGLRRPHRADRRAGRLQGDTNPHPLLRKSASLHGIFVASRAMFERMNTAIEVNGLQPVIDRVFDFEEAADAYRYQQSPSLFGKVVIRI